MSQDGQISRFSRREILWLGASAGLGMASVLACRGRESLASGSGSGIPSWTTELRPLAPNVYAYVQGGGPNISNASISNAGLIVGDNDLLAIDALAAPLHAKAFIAAAQEATGGKPFGRLINTHHHGDHTNGNQFFLPAEIVSHEFCREEVVRSHGNLKPGAVFDRREGWADGTEERKPAPPVTTFRERP